MITIELERCRRCLTCVDVCPQRTLAAGGDGYPAQVRADACMECGACAMNCDAGAITVAAGVGCFAALLNEALFGKKATCG